MAVFAHYLQEHPEILFWLSRMEDRFLHKELEAMHTVRPVYVTGLARSGTTVMLEALHSYPGMAAHSYGDYPFIQIPYIWNCFFRPFIKSGAFRERAHRDGLRVNNNSPESFEEIIWSHFFPEAHNPELSQCMEASNSNPAFEQFYQNHIKKLVLAKKGERYLSKANYNMSRIPYLHRFLPDAWFIVMIRHPENFIASSMKQDRLFCKEQTQHPKKLVHTNSTAHYEFGLNKKPVNFGNTEETRSIINQWKNPQHQVEAWARYWQLAYSYVLALTQSKALEPYIKIIRFEEMCAHPEAIMEETATWCGMRGDREAIEPFAPKIHAPSYYRHDFSREEKKKIAKITGGTAHAFGYDLL